MKWFANMTTKGKLFIGFGIMILLIIIGSGSAYISMAGLHKTMLRLSDVEVPITIEIVKSRAIISTERMLLARMIEIDRKSDLDMLYRNVKEYDKELDGKIAVITELGGDNKNYQELVNQFAAVRKEFIASRDMHTVALIYAGKSNDARKYFFGTQYQLYEKMLDITSSMSKLSEQADKLLTQESGQKVEMAFFIFVLIGIVGVVVGVVLVLYLTVIIAYPLTQVTGIAERIAYGDLTVQVPSVQRTDEVGALLMSFGMMVESQKMMAKEITLAVDVLAENTADESVRDIKGLNRLAQKLKGLVEQYKI